MDVHRGPGRCGCRVGHVGLRWRRRLRFPVAGPHVAAPGACPAPVHRHRRHEVESHRQPPPIAGGEHREKRRCLRPVAVPRDAVVARPGAANGDVGAPRSGNHVVANHVAARRPVVLVDHRRHQHAVQRMAGDHVALDDVALAANKQHAVAEPRRLEGQRRRQEVAVIGDEIGDDPRLSLRRQELGVERVRHESGAILLEDGTRDHHAARVGAAVAEGVVLGHDVVQHRPAGLALPDVEAGIGRPARVRPLEDAVLRVERVDAVVAVVARREVRPAPPGHARPEEAVEHGVAGRHVLDRDPVGQGDHAVAANELAVNDRGVAVEPAQHDRRRRDRDLLLVRARAHEHEVARGGGVNGGLDGWILRRYAPHRARRRRHRGAARRIARRVRDLSDEQRAGHAAPIRRTVVGAVVAIDTGRIEPHRGQCPCRHGQAAVGALRAPRLAVGRDGVVRTAPDIGEGHRRPRRHADRGRRKGVVVHAHLHRRVVGVAARTGEDGEGEDSAHRRDATGRARPSQYVHVMSSHIGRRATPRSRAASRDRAA